MIQNFENRLGEIVGQDRVSTGEPLGLHTTFRIGGPADYFVTPSTREELGRILLLCKEEGSSYYVIGNGSNLLAGDKGFRGTMIHLGEGMDHFTAQQAGVGQWRVMAGAGILLSKMAAEAHKRSLTGFEFAGGIPGTLGGAIAMNAGAYGGEIRDVITGAFLMDGEGHMFHKNREELELGYRSSAVQKNQWIVLEGEFSFSEGKMEEILEKTREYNGRRREKQPLELPSAGSTFKRPEGCFAGKLIMDAGLRGFRIGDMMISEKHCGFVVNAGNGTAEQAKRLISEVDRIVFEKFGVHLEPEVKFLGE